MSGLAVVATAWLASSDAHGRHVAVLNAFVLYHLGIGVARVLLVLDETTDPRSQPHVEHLDPRVRAHVSAGRVELYYARRSTPVPDSASASMVTQRHEVWRYDPRGGDGGQQDDCYCRLLYDTLPSYRRLVGALDKGDSVARQILHAELAMRRCVEHNRHHHGPQRLTWLAHLDLDELLYCEGFREPLGPSVSSRALFPPVETLRDLVQALETAELDQLTLVNYEAIPTAPREVGNYFVHATRFRRHTARIPLSRQRDGGGGDGDDGGSSSSSAGRETALSQLAIWTRRSPYGQYFLFYDNGKSLVRVAEDLVAASVHHWALAPGAPTRTFRSMGNFFDPRRETGTWQEPDARLRACVLHYPVCGLDWLRDKYRRLGAFEAVWGATSGLPIPPCFHLEARDASQLRDPVARDNALLELYQRQVRLDPKDCDRGPWEALVATGICEEIDVCRRFLQRLGFFQEATEVPRDNATKTIDDRSAVPPPDRQVDDDQGKQEMKILTTTTASAGAIAAVNVSSPSRAAPPMSHTGIEKQWLLAAITDSYL